MYRLIYGKCKPNIQPSKFGMKLTEMLQLWTKASDFLVDRFKFLKRVVHSSKNFEIIFETTAETQTAEMQQFRRH